jgi:uncharacterized protein (DUF885 family)
MKQTILATMLATILFGCADDKKASDTTSTKSHNSASDITQDNIKNAQDLAIKSSDKVPSRDSIDQLIAKHTAEFLKTQPGLSTSLDIDPVLAGGHYNNRHPDYSPKGFLDMQAIMNRQANELKQIDGSQLSNNDKMHLKIVEIIERYYAGDQDFLAGYIDTWGGHLPFVLSQINGPLIDVPKMMTSQQPIRNAAEVADYIERMRAFDQLVDAVIAKVKFDAQHGVRLPAKLYPKTYAYLQNFVGPNPSEHPLVSYLVGKLENITSISDTDKDNITKEATSIVAKTIYPAFNKVSTLLQEMEPLAPKEDGIWAQKGGASFYQHEIEYLGDSDLSADQIHQIGLDEVKRISEEMNLILVENGYKEGSVGARMVALGSEPRFLYEDSDAGRQQLLNDLNDEIKVIMQKAPSLFNVMPTQKVIVKRMPVDSEAGSPGGFYNSPSLDGSRPGTYTINLRDMKGLPNFGLKTLTYHEAVPGHHFQIALNMAQTDIGLFRQNASFNGFIEGWALYSELVAKEMNMYEGDPWGDLGRLQAELYRAVRLVVDTGLHYKKWTREQAIDYFHTTTGTSLTDVTSEVERYMAWPGQALGYKLGMLKMVELRALAKSELGEKFDIKAFHDLILLRGARPMILVEQDVRAWINTQK